jgi:hypothetical protein
LRILVLASCRDNPLAETLKSHAATSDDALVATSFRNYYPDTARLFSELVARGRHCAHLSHRCAWCRRWRSASISQQTDIS